jgi:4-hydroxy-3-methylbut-2-enyl diphosphate reductase IspH
MEYPNLDRAFVKLYSKSGHSALLQSSELENRASISANQVGSNLQINVTAGQSTPDDAVVVEVICIKNVSNDIRIDKLGSIAL